MVTGALSRAAAAILLALLVVMYSGAAPLAVPPQAPEALRIFLRGAPKNHGPAGNGLHDSEVWVRSGGRSSPPAEPASTADSSFQPRAQLESTDVLVMFAANAGTILGAERASLESFLKRGGGIVCLHDSVVTAREPQWFKTIVGGAWENGVAKYFEGENTYYYVNSEHPITKGASNFTITDEVYWNLHMMPDAQILAVSMQPKAAGSATSESGIPNLIPQMWVYHGQLEGGRPYRAFVSLLGHHFSTFASPHVRAIVLRGIAWAGNRPPDSLATAEELSGLQ